MLTKLIQTAPEHLDLTNEGHLEEVVKTADSMLAFYPTYQMIEGLEAELISDKERIPLLLHLAVKLAKSKRIVSAIDLPVHISIVFAVYKEHNRIRSRAEHPHGENILLRKIAQLQWLFDPFPNFTWDLIIVDDGCPNQSGQLLLEIHRNHCPETDVRILFLQDAIDRNEPVVRPMTSTDDSRKGGAIQYGLWTAAQTQRENHILVFTDADLSTHLGQTGLLIDAMLQHGKDAAIGSRREPTSVVIKKGMRNMRGKLFIYLWKRLIPNLNYIVDTQCGFKGFKAQTVRDIIHGLIEKQFAFDIELLLKTELRRCNAIAKVPVAWIDSEAASTTTELEPYLPMLKSIVAMYRKYLHPNPSSDKYASFIEGLDKTSWGRLLENIPVEITEREPVEFSEYSGVQVGDLEAIIKDSSSK